MSSKPVKLSPQEDRVFHYLKTARTRDRDVIDNGGLCYVEKLYRCAKQTDAKRLPAHRRMQQHVGVIVARINKKQKKYVIKPGGKDAPRTYVLRRR